MDLAPLRAFLAGLNPAHGSVTDDESLLARGLIDSLNMVELVLHIEQEYGIAVEDEELMPDNFETIAHIGRFVERKIASVEK